MGKVEFRENMILTTGTLTNEKLLKLKQELYKRYAGVGHKHIPIKKVYEPITPIGFLSKFFGRP